MLLNILNDYSDLNVCRLVSFIKEILDNFNKVIILQMFEESFNQGLRSNMLFLAPELMDTLNISLFPNSIYKYIKNEVGSAVEKGSAGREGDYIDSLVDLRKKGGWEGNDGEIIGERINND